MNDEKFVKSVSNKDSQIVAYEREPFSKIGFRPGESMRSFVLFEIKMMQLRSSYLVFSNLHQIGFPRLHVFKRSLTVKEFKFKMFQILRPLLIIP